MAKLVLAGEAPEGSGGGRGTCGKIPKSFGLVEFSPARVTTSASGRAVGVSTGRANCPYYAKAELLADYLQANLPDFRVHKITQHPDRWEVRRYQSKRGR